MDFEFSEDQNAIVDAVRAIVQSHSDISAEDRRRYAVPDPSLYEALKAGGFFAIASEASALEATAAIIEIAKSPRVIEVGASMLVAPLLCGDEVEGPVCLIEADKLGKAHRNLPGAGTVLVCQNDAIYRLSVEGGQVEDVASIYAYPFGRFHSPPRLDAACLVPGATGEDFLQWSRVALCAEIVGAAESALDFTLDYVKQRKIFSRPVGSFQAVQHRLAMCHKIVEGLRFLTLKAAWSGDPCDADYAACYAQQHVQQLVHDLHQFHGAMAVTNEHLLHFWTYRIRALQSECGGTYAAALSLADRLWGPATKAETA